MGTTAGRRFQSEASPLEAGPGLEALQRAHASYAQRDWDDAFQWLSRADAAVPLAADDLDRLAWSAGLTARDDLMLAALERLYQARVDGGDPLGAARAALWLGFRLFARGEAARAGGWLARSQRLVDDHGAVCVEQGYLLLPATQRLLNLGQFETALATAARAAALGERFGDRDLTAFARNLQGRSLLRLGRLAEGLGLMDETLVAVTTGELSPVVTGLVYCSAIAACQRIYAFDRSREWTAALDGWCAAQPQLVLFKGHCLVHRAQILQLTGAWGEALDEARRAVAKCIGDFDSEAAGLAHYEQGEIHRLRGDAAQAEAAYRQASRCGVEPQPGLALLRLAQGQGDAAANASRRVLAATSDPLARARQLPAHVAILLAVGALDEARAASRELAQVAAGFRTDALAALAWETGAALQLAESRAQDMPGPLRRAFAVWRQLGAPFAAARLRVALARACVALGDAEGARLELEAAREVFAGLGARPSLSEVEALLAPQGQARQHDHAAGLTGREMQVLRLVAAGLTNKAIARELALSGKTVDRHLSNIFAKTGVASRAAATAFAYEHRLV